MNLVPPRPSPFSQHQQGLASWHFLTALALLALNDHVLKYAGMLPPWLTGKLSDFAGLYVAPFLLCTLLRQRSRRALALCSLLTAIVFTTLELSPLAARTVEQWTHSIGFPWVLTCDVTDLLALPMVWLGYRVFSAPAQRRLADGNAVRVRPSLRWQERVVAALATLACAATSDPEEFGTIWTSGPVVVNGNENTDVELRLQVPREDIFIDCAAIAESPGEHLPRSAFGPINRLSLAPLQTLILDQWTFPTVSGCSLLLLEIEGRAPVVFFWQSDRFELREVPWQLTKEQVKRVAKAPQYVTVLFNGDEAERFKDNGNLAFPFEPRTRVDDACEPNPVVPELWTPFSRFGVPLLLANKRYSADGCFELTFGTATEPTESPSEPPPSTENEIPEDAGPTSEEEVIADAGVPTIIADAGAPSSAGFRWLQQNIIAEGRSFWLCVPEEALPFEIGDELTIEQSGAQLVVERTTDRASLSVTNDGIGTVSLVTAEFTQTAVSECAFRVFEEPTLTARRSSVRISTPWGAATLKPGEQQWLHSDTRNVLVGVIEAREDVVGSSLGPHTSGFMLTVPVPNNTDTAAQDLSPSKAEQP